MSWTKISCPGWVVPNQWRAEGGKRASDERALGSRCRKKGPKMATSRKNVMMQRPTITLGLWVSPRHTSRHRSLTWTVVRSFAPGRGVELLLAVAAGLLVVFISGLLSNVYEDRGPYRAHRRRSWRSARPRQ